MGDESKTILQTINANIAHDTGKLQTFIQSNIIKTPKSKRLHSSMRNNNNHHHSACSASLDK